MIVLAFGAFALVKLLGYSLYCGRVRAEHWCFDWRTGGARTIMGLVFGAFYGLAMQTLPDPGGPAFYAGLIPIRIVEWTLLLRFFFPEPVPQRKAPFIAGGVLVSFLLDALGVLAAFVTPGGLWIC